MQLSNCQAQRVAPGVPPQQYQQYQQSNVPIQHGQPQQVNMQYQQQPNAPMQHGQPQQVNMQHQQQVPLHQQVPMQQAPIQQQQQQQQPHGHGHGHNHGHPQQVLNAANIANEKEHLQQHMDIPMDTSKMTDQELQFHYFKMHDADNNNKLDGCELIKSLIHWHEHGNKDPATPDPGEKIFEESELEALIDPILSMDDTNKDGFIDYAEFIQAQHKAAATGQKPQ